MKKTLLLALIIACFLLGCQSVADWDYQLQLEGLQKENELVKSQLTLGEESDEETRNYLRSTLNLSFKLFDAMNTADYDYLQSVLSSTSKLDRDNNRFIFEGDGYYHEQQFIGTSLATLEFRFYDFSGDTFLLGFASVGEDGNASSYLEFIMENGELLFHDLKTN